MRSAVQAQSRSKIMTADFDCFKFDSINEINIINLFGVTNPIELPNNWEIFFPPAGGLYKKYGKKNKKRKEREENKEEWSDNQHGGFVEVGRSGSTWI